MIRKLLPLLLIATCSLIAWFLGIGQYLSLEQLRQYHVILEDFVVNHYLLTVLIYMVSYILIVATSIPGASFMTLLGGYLFGQLIGTVVVVCAATIGATAFFIIARMSTQEALHHKAGSWLKKMQSGFQDNALSYLLSLRLLPIFPFVIINIVAALMQIPLKTFILGTFFGIIPGSFCYVALGVGLREFIATPSISPTLILDPQILVALAGLSIIALLPLIVRKLRKES